MKNFEDSSNWISEQLTKSATKHALESAAIAEEQKIISEHESEIQFEKERIVSVIRDDAIELAEYAKQSRIKPKLYVWAQKKVPKVYKSKTASIIDSLKGNYDYDVKDFPVWIWRIIEIEVNNERDNWHRYKSIDIRADDGIFMVNTFKRKFSENRPYELIKETNGEVGFDINSCLANDEDLLPIRIVSSSNSNEIIDKWREIMASGITGKSHAIKSYEFYKKYIF